MAVKKFCPYCHSTDIKNDYSSHWMNAYAVRSFVCERCQVTGTFFPEAEEQDIPELKPL